MRALQAVADRRLPAVTALVAALASVHTSDASIVRALVSSTYHAHTGRIAIIDDFALVEWVHPPSLGRTIGQVVVIRRRGVWKIVAAGGATYTPGEVEHFGVPAGIARQLEAQVRKE